jgi:hypothetical protein
MYRTLGGRVLLVVVDMRLEAGAVRLDKVAPAVAGAGQGGGGRLPS